MAEQSSDAVAEPVGEAPAPSVSEPVRRGRVPRTWAQRLTIATAFVCAVGAFAAAGALYAGQRIIEDRNIAPKIADPSQSAAAGGFEIADGEVVGVDGSTPISTDPAAPPETFPPAEPEAQNFLITGADNNSCVDPSSPYSAAFGDRTSLGERSDTIMMLRVNPATSQVAVLSFPRDLWVTIAGRSSKQRINVAYERDNPQKLIDTISYNFGIVTDHFIQVDFCAFKTLVDAVGGVAVPFDTPVRDPHTGLDVPTAGCYTFNGDAALAYARSRKLEYLDANGEWKQDPTSDLGRISRQQDFLRRTVSRLLSKGAFNPDVAGGLIKTSSDYLTVDDGLTLSKELEFAGVLKNVDPAQITTYQIESKRQIIQGNDVLVPEVKSKNMQDILNVFRGWATLASAPDQVFQPTTVATTQPPNPVDGQASPTVQTSPPDAPDATPSTTVPTVPTVAPDQNVFGVVPDPNITC